MRYRYIKNRKYQIIADTTVDIVDYIEEHYKEWGGIKGDQKMEKFIELLLRNTRKLQAEFPKERSSRQQGWGLKPMFNGPGEGGMRPTREIAELHESLKQ